MVRKQPNVYCEISALSHVRGSSEHPCCAQEYRMTDKIFFGTDFPFRGFGGSSFAGLRNINKVVEGTNLLCISAEVIEGILHSNPFEHWWHQRFVRSVGLRAD